MGVQAAWEEVKAIKPKHSEAVTQEKELGIRWGKSPKPDTTALHVHLQTLRETVIQAVFSHVQVNVRKKCFVASSILEAFVKRKISIGFEKETLYSSDTA